MQFSGVAGRAVAGEDESELHSEADEDRSVEERKETVVNRVDSFSVVLSYPLTD